MEIRSPNRARHTYVQRLLAPPSEVLPLLCPVREAEWAEGWDPLWVASDSGVAERECVFVTPGGDGPDAAWIVTRHEPDAGLVEMVKFTADVTVCVLSIKLCAAPQGCDAEVTYSHTSLGPRGDAFVAAFTREYYDGFMREWETQMNHFLSTGEKLTQTHPL